ncbi:hypothetical protein QQF64_034320 [Cirrhinus molitorella]|uniref:Lipoxygenase domain-containing protein n=1 Tax=Cirrhinus molitorella TaxID=172907 RepID=A0ABR3L4Z7_9TELE
MGTLTYKSLCFPEDIKARGMEDVPKYYYRDDGMKVWEAITGRWKSSNSSQLSKSLESREQLVEYLTVVIFTASAQHAAVNFGQFDWYGWIPTVLHHAHAASPAEGPSGFEIYHGESADGEMLQQGCGNSLGLTRLFLGMYPDMYFTEQPAKEAIKAFQHKLEEVTNTIKNRNEELTLPYCYLSPDKIPNSVAI